MIPQKSEKKELLKSILMLFFHNFNTNVSITLSNEVKITSFQHKINYYMIFRIAKNCIKQSIIFLTNNINFKRLFKPLKNCCTVY